MKTQPRAAITVAAALLALSACGVAASTSCGTPAAHASAVPARHAVADSSSAELRNLAEMKRDAAGAALQAARAAPSPDSGLAACSSLSDGHPAAARDYPQIAAEFAGSRWPDLRLSGLAYVEIATTRPAPTSSNPSNARRLGPPSLSTRPSRVACTGPRCRTQRPDSPPPRAPAHTPSSVTRTSPDKPARSPRSDGPPRFGLQLTDRQARWIPGWSRSCPPARTAWRRGDLR